MYVREGEKVSRCVCLCVRECARLCVCQGESQSVCVRGCARMCACACVRALDDYVLLLRLISTF